MATRKKPPPSLPKTEPSEGEGPLPSPSSDAESPPPSSERLTFEDDASEPPMRARTRVKPAEAPAPPPPEPGRKPYRVWRCGTLQRNGKTHQPGDVLFLLPEEASKIPCLTRVDGG